MAGKLKITYTRSSIRMVDRHKKAVRALGLRKLHQTVIHADTPTMRGMIRVVDHLVTWEKISD